VTPVSASSGLELVTGEAAGEAAVVAVTTGLEVATGELMDGEAVETGEGLDGQRPQVAAQKPPVGAVLLNMKLSLHLPYAICSIGNLLQPLFRSHAQKQVT